MENSDTHPISNCKIGFKTIEEINENLSNFSNDKDIDKCASCPNATYEDGILFCKFTIM